MHEPVIQWGGDTPTGWKGADLCAAAVHISHMGDYRRAPMKAAWLLANAGWCWADNAEGADR